VVVAPDGDFSAFLSVEDAPTATEIAVDIYARATSADAVADGTTGEREATFPTVALTGEATGDRTTGFAIHLFGAGEDNPDPRWGWRLTQGGVYPVGIRLRDADGEVLATLTTQLIRLPDADDQVTPVDTSVLLAVHAPPPAERQARQAGNRADPTLVADLRRILTAFDGRSDVPAALSITPDALTRLAADPDARDLVDDLRALVAEPGHEVLDAPYVDIDPAALVAAGLDDVLAAERDLGRRTLARLLEAPVRGTWELDRPVGPEAADALRQRGIYRVVVPDAALRGTPATPGPVDVSLGSGELRAWSTLSDRLVTAPEGDAVLAAHRLLGVLVATSTGRGGGRVVLPVDVETAEPATLGIVLDALRYGTPYFRAAALGGALASEPVGSGTLTAPSARDLGRYPADLRAAEAALDSYASMVGDDAQPVAVHRRELAVTAAAGLDPAVGATDARRVLAALQAPFHAIAIPARDKVTLGARDARFPLPISSDLDEPVDVVVELQANDRLSFPVARIPVTLDGSHTVLQVRVRVRTAGDTPVRVIVRSPDGGVILAEGRYTIRSTAVSGVGLLLTIGAAAFLALWWGRHWHRSRRRPRHARRSGRPAAPAVDG
jgi:hypothetical protein